MPAPGTILRRLSLEPDYGMAMMTQVRSHKKEREKACDVTVTATATEELLPAERTARLLAWYEGAARRLPWRRRDGARPDPYRVWLSEIMLQQTTVAAVIPYYGRFLRRWPSVEALAAAQLDEVLTLWAGLGYYARARNLHRCAREIAARGGLWPTTEKELQALPGIGPYTAAAIAAIAFEQPVAAVDGNVKRVIARAYAIDAPPEKARDLIAARAQALVPGSRPGDFAQALMDLGATLCLPKNPNCADCPWGETCLARARGLTAELPRRAKRRPRPRRTGTVFWVARGEAGTGGHEVLLRPRPPDGLLGGMIEFPSTPWLDGNDAMAGEPPEDAAPWGSDWQRLPAPVRHVFTHFELELTVLAGRATGAALPDGAFWWPVARLDDQALPSVMKKVAAAVLERRAGRAGNSR